MKKIFVALTLIALLATPVLADRRHHRGHHRTNHHGYHHYGHHRHHQHHTSVVVPLFSFGVNMGWHVGSPPVVVEEHHHYHHMPPPPPTGYWHYHVSNMSFCYQHNMWHVHHWHYE